jgi:predicted nucleic acid-binding protein
MTTWLPDASVLLAWEDRDDDHHEGAKRLLESEAQLVTLDLAWYEVTNVAITAWRDRDAARRVQRVVSALDDAGGLVRCDRSLIADAGDLAALHRMSAYDAAYVATAQRLGAHLVSCDLRDLVGPGFGVTPSQALEMGAA